MSSDTANQHRTGMPSKETDTTGTVGADKGYDTRDFVAECRHLKVTPHVAQNTKRGGGSAIDARTTRHNGYTVSQKKRKRIEECFRWLKTIALAEGAPSRNPESGLGVHLRGRSLQPGADAESAGQPGWCRMSPGRSVPARGQSGQNE